MHNYLLSLALLGMLGGLSGPLAHNAAGDSSSKEYIYGENIIPNGDFSVSAGQYVLPTAAPTSGVVAGIGPLDPNQIVAMAEEGNESNTVLKLSGTGWSSFWKSLAITPGETYDVSFDYKVVGTCDNLGFAFWSPSAGNRMPEINLFDATQAADVTFTDKDNNWKNAKVTRLFDAAHTFDSIQVWCNTSNADIYLDNFKIIKQGTSDNIWPAGDFEGFLDYAASAISSTPDSNGIYGTNATLGKNCVKIENGGSYGVTVNGLSEKLYTVDVDWSSTVSSGDKLSLKIYSPSGDKEISFINDESQKKSATFEKIADATKLELNYTGANPLILTKWNVKPTYEYAFDPSKTYYESKNYIVNGDFEKFDEGTKFSEDQLEGAWGSVSGYDNPGRIIKDGDNKVAGIGKFSSADSKVYSSMFVMTPDDIVTGDLIRFQYDYKLKIDDAADTYTEINSCFVGGANQSYYMADLKKIGYDASYNSTSGVEAAHYPLKTETLANGYTRVTLDFQVTADKVQWNSIRWLFTAHNEGEYLYVDNVSLKFLSETPWTVDVASVEIEGGDIEMKAGESKTLTATVNPSNADDKTLTWSSSNEAVATVDADGKVTAIKEGVAEITAEASNGVKDSIVVTVLASEKGDGSEKNNTGLIVGCVVGGVVVVGAAIACGVIFGKKKGKKAE